MSDRVFLRVLLCVTAICVAFTLLHFAYAIYGYQHCSIIQFIAKELW